MCAKHLPCSCWISYKTYPLLTPPPPPHPLWPSQWRLYAKCSPLCVRILSVSVPSTWKCTPLAPHIVNAPWTFLGKFRPPFTLLGVRENLNTYYIVCGAIFPQYCAPHSKCFMNFFYRQKGAMKLCTSSHAKVGGGKYLFKKKYTHFTISVTGVAM